MPSLSPKTNILGFDNAYHLLRRTTYNITKARILEYSVKTPQDAITALFTFTAPSPPSPLNNLGETIVPTAANPTVTDSQNTVNSVRNDLFWWLYSALKDNSAQHRIAFFLHLMFVADDNASFWTNYDYKELLRFHTNGSLKDLAVRMTMNPRMLTFLNNNLNQNTSPNQNYAREFLELFTILKGPQIATGNYTNYTEVDVQQAAKVLTGLTLTNTIQLDKTARLTSLDPLTNLPTGEIKINKHDTGSKTFSSAFSGQTIAGGNTEAAIKSELQNFVNMVFNQEETAKAYCRRIYRYFVGREITTDIENGIIVPMATALKADNYNILPVLGTLLKSKHFYDEEDAISGDQTYGSLARSPIDLYLHMFSILQLQMPPYATNPSAIHSLMNVVNTYSTNMGLPIFRPQSVNGYSGYSSSPNYDKNWITTSSLRIRYNNTIDYLINGLTYNGFLFKLNTPAFVRDSGYFSAPGNADTLLNEFLEMMFAFVPTGSRYDELKTAFLNNLSVTNWNNEWNAYLNTNNATSVKIALDRLVKAVIKSPEFQIM
ncbi:hypothetical protein ASG01_08450 [Chryseobacterium sp. Leaf180]|uniref:DUF1800 family protein n=1 Tax=Chryseobacterium sp. Leaf180 TaxID=1736289 RepID=UPI0007005643|nr:DUF1800 family protein [Chryseobacterium sp. Leaf180]KQR93879.1 hypothetical protein ASG01_08450 [Chryseobacterium sp. Leaf180]